MKTKLMAQAWQALENAYAPYSSFRVGACVICHDGTCYLGANIENASYGLTSCAERNALFSAYSDGQRSKDIAALAIVSEAERLSFPCGACRQVISELMESDTPIYLANHYEEAVYTLKELMPYAFDKEDLFHV